jgi:hypothetical protein
MVQMGQVGACADDQYWRELSDSGAVYVYFSPRRDRDLIRFFRD